MNLLGIIFCMVAVVLFCFVYKNDRKYLSLYVLAVVLFIPKINILTLTTGAAAGLRTDDLIIFMFVLVLLVEKFETIKDVFTSKVFMIYVLYVIASVFSFVLGIATGQTFNFKLSLFSLIRKVEYFCFIFVGYDFIYHNKGDYQTPFNKLLYAFTTFTGVVSVLQYASIIGAYRASSYEILGVATGTFNGPYEIGGFFAILFAYYFYNFIKNKERGTNLYYSMVSILIVLLSKSRSSLVIIFAIIIVMCLLYCSKKYKIIISVSGAIVAIVFMMAIYYNLLPILDRFATLDISAAIDAIKYYWKNVNYEQYADIIKSGRGVELYAYGYGDFSFNVRMFKWIAVLKTLPKNLLFGYGFGSNTTLDGSYVKLLVENGLIGTLLFISALVYTIQYRKNNNIGKFLVWILIIQFMGAIFIDILEASKIMEFLWVLVGVSLYEIDEDKNSQKNNIEWLIQEQKIKNKFIKKEIKKLWKELF